MVGGGGHCVAEQQHEARHQGARVAGEEDLVTQPQPLRVSRQGDVHVAEEAPSVI